MQVQVYEKGMNLNNAIVVHQYPDIDALFSAYLLWWVYGCVIVLAPNTLLAADLVDAFAVADMGKEFDISAKRFDHHQWSDNTTSAAELVFNAYFATVASERLRWFVRLVTDCDLGLKTEVALWSRKAGPHALLNAWKVQQVDQCELVTRFFGIFDRLFVANDLDFEDIVALDSAAMDHFYSIQQRDRQELKKAVVFRRGGVVAIVGSSPEAAYEQLGAKIVLQHNPKDQVTRLVRDGAPHLGQLVSRVGLREPKRWFQHPVGFFCGTSLTAGTNGPLLDRLEIIAAHIEKAWRASEFEPAAPASKPLHPVLGLQIMRNRRRWLKAKLLEK